MANKLTDSSLWWRKREKTISLIIHIVHTYTHKFTHWAQQVVVVTWRRSQLQMKRKNKVFQLKNIRKYIYL